MPCCAYSCTQYMLLTHADDLLCLQLHTVRSPYTVHTANPSWCLAVPTAAHSTVSIHSTYCWHMLMPCCAYSCTQYGLHTQYILLTHANALLCLQLHTVLSRFFPRTFKFSCVLSSHRMHRAPRLCLVTGILSNEYLIPYSQYSITLNHTLNVPDIQKCLLEMCCMLQCKQPASEIYICGWFLKASRTIQTLHALKASRIL
jgi:hypothetical protein